jgi:hypothetical protein
MVIAGHPSASLAIPVPAIIDSELEFVMQHTKHEAKPSVVSPWIDV